MSRPSDSALECPYCIQDTFVAPSEVLLFSHIRLVHSLDPNFNIQCSLEGCSRTFNHFRTYQNHLLTHRTASNKEQEQDSLDMGTEDPNVSFEHDHSGIFLNTDLQSYAAKWILKTSETRSLTRAATLGIVEDVSDLIDVVSQSLKSQIRQILNSSGVDQEITSMVEDVFSCSATKPFGGLTSFHQQLQYYRNHFNLIVCSDYYYYGVNS